MEGGPDGGTSPPLMSLLMPRSRKRPRPLMNELLCECFTDRLNICAQATQHEDQQFVNLETSRVGFERLQRNQKAS